MSKKKEHLSYEDRVKIEVFIDLGLSNNQIAKSLGKSPSSITREINRNKGGPERRHYSARFASNGAHFRKAYTTRQNPRKKPQVWEYVEEKLKQGWSPEIISGRISLDHPELCVSYEAIYQHVYNRRKDLAGFLATRRAFRRKKGPRRAKKSVIPNRLSIVARPLVVNHRKEMGHWESDSMVSDQSKASLNVMVERLSRYCQITKIKDLTAQETQQAIVSRLKTKPEELRRTLTYDNGFENRNHEHINEKLGTTSYFCEPYHSWEKGSVEQLNMLIRRYLPKKTDFALVTAEQIQYIENQLNSRPRKCLEFRTPSEIVNSFL